MEGGYIIRTKMSSKYFQEDLIHDKASAIPGSSEYHKCSRPQLNSIINLNYL